MQVKVTQALACVEMLGRPSMQDAGGSHGDAAPGAAGCGHQAHRS